MLNETKLMIIIMRVVGEKNKCIREAAEVPAGNATGDEDRSAIDDRTGVKNWERRKICYKFKARLSTLYHLLKIHPQAPM